MSSRNGAVAPSEYPPPVDPVGEFVKRELDSEDERIEVGVAIIGGGTAGLATANRLLQLLGDDPETMERLGEVPVAIIEKAKTCGGHNLSGAVMRPKPNCPWWPFVWSQRTHIKVGPDGRVPIGSQLLRVTWPVALVSVAGRPDCLSIVFNRSLPVGRRKSIAPPATVASTPVERSRTIRAVPPSRLSV